MYAERLSRCFYENYVGSIVDWYAATLFRREPHLTFEGKNERAKKFFAEFTEDCDLKGASFTEFFRKQFIEALVSGKSFVLIDFPRLAQSRGNASGRRRATGASRAYLVSYAADELINWSYDDHGHYQWVVLRTESLKKAKIEDPAWVKETRWVYYDKDNLPDLRTKGAGNGRDATSSWYPKDLTDSRSRPRALDGAADLRRAVAGEQSRLAAAGAFQ